MLTVVARCKDAEKWAHELSKVYPKYSQRETSEKLQHAASDHVAPVTCSYVQADLNGERLCSACLFRGYVNSPIAIGRLKPGDGEVDTGGEASHLGRIVQKGSSGLSQGCTARYLPCPLCRAAR